MKELATENIVIGYSIMWAVTTTIAIYSFHPNVYGVQFIILNSVFFATIIYAVSVLVRHP